jgi:ribosomal protein S12 methylthiotransferase accessory factor
MTRTTSRNSILNPRVPAAVEASLTDWSRLAPMLAGASCIRTRGRKAVLVVRHAGEMVEIEAPAALLDQVFDLCDGIRTARQAVDSIADEKARAKFADFLAFLLGEGALIDASLASAHAARYAFQRSPFGAVAPAALTETIAGRFLWNTEEAATALPESAVKVESAPLDRFLSSRVTSKTFADQSISARALHPLLWSLAGVVSATHPRKGDFFPQRTLASAGGMYLLEIYLALRRPVGDYAPGVYRVHYPQERMVFLQKTGETAEQLARAFVRPWELTYATGAIFLAADPAVGAIRYLSRSLQFLFMEAGAALHNGALSADALELGYATIGGYHEPPAARLCGLDRQLLLGAALFGAKPSPDQVETASAAAEIDFAWADDEPSGHGMGLHRARARVGTGVDGGAYAYGSNADPVRAARQAIENAVAQACHDQPRRLVEGRIGEIGEALDPRQFVRYTDAQYQLPGFPCLPFSPSQAYPWVDGMDLGAGKKVHVLGELVFSRAGLAALGHSPPKPYTQASVAGCCTGTSLEDATLRALHAAIEHDALMRHWLAQKPGIVQAQGQWPGEVTHRLAALTSAGCTVTIQQLPAACTHVALVSAQHGERHFTATASAAGASFTQAVNSAIDTLQARVHAWMQGQLPRIKLAEETATAGHHVELYGLRRHFRRADKVLFPSGAVTGSHWPPDLAASSLSSLLGKLCAQGMCPVAVDITPPQSHVDQGRTPITVVKALVPGLLPVSFGHQREALGMIHRSPAGAKFPHPFGDCRN